MYRGSVARLAEHPIAAGINTLSINSATFLAKTLSFCSGFILLAMNMWFISLEAGKTYSLDHHLYDQVGLHERNHVVAVLSHNQHRSLY